MSKESSANRVCGVSICGVGELLCILIQCGLS